MLRFEDIQKTRFERQIVLPEVGLSGQETLNRAKVLIVGMGGLGCPAALNLAASGVQNLTLVDHDRVEMSNLHRQTLYGPSDVGQPKVVVAAARIENQTGVATISTLQDPVCEANVIELVRDHDLVLDCSDNFRTRYLVGDACRVLGRSLVTAALNRFNAQLAVFSGNGGPCYRCLFPEPVRRGVIGNCAQSGVLGTFSGLMGSLQAHEAIKLILGLPNRSGHLLCVDGLTGEQSLFPVPSQLDCPACRIDETAFAQTKAWPLALPEGDPKLSDRARECGFFIQILRDSVSSLLVDARTRAEFETSAIPGAVLLSEIEKDLSGLFPSRPTLLVYCETGLRSDTAVQQLRAKGYEAYSLTGGLARLKPEDRDKLGKAVATLLAEGFTAHDPSP